MIKKILTSLIVMGAVLAGGFGIVHADVTNTFWNQTSANVLMTNTGNGLANADIHVAHCYIGTTNTTPCGGGGGGVTQLIAGSGISLSPSGGTGAVTVTATGGGGTIGGTAVATEVAYGASTANTLTQDSNFIRIPGSITNIVDSFASGSFSRLTVGTNVLPFVTANLSGSGSVHTDAAGSAGIASINGTSIGLGSDSVIGISQDTATSDQSALFMSAGHAAGFNYDHSGNEAYLNFNPNSADYGYNNGTHSSGIHTGSNTLQFVNGGNNYTWPTTQSTGTQALLNNGSGTLSWGSTPSGTGSSTLATTQIAYGGPGNVMTSDANLTWNGATQAFGVGNGSQTNFKLLSAGSATLSLANAQSFIVKNTTSGGNIMIMSNAGGMGNFWEAGDIGALQNHTQLSVADGQSQVRVQAANGFIATDTSANTWLNVAPNSHNVTVGNGSILELDGTGGPASALFKNNNHTFGYFNYGLGEIQFGDVSNTIHGGGLDLNYNTAVSTLGDFGLNNNGTVFSVDDINKNVTTKFGGVFNMYGFGNIFGDRIASFDNANRVASIGDVDFDFNGNLLKVDDANNQITADTNGTFAVRDIAQNPFLYYDHASGVSWLGDGNAESNATGVKVNNPGGTVVLGDIFGNNTNFVVDKTNGILKFGDVNTTTQALYFDLVNKFDLIGDTNGGGNGTQINVNDGGKYIAFTNTQADPTIQSVAYGTTTTLDVGDSDLEVGGTGSGATTVNITTTDFPVGSYLTIADFGANSSTDNITVDVGTGNTIHGAAVSQTYVIGSNGAPDDGFTLLIKKVTSTSWKIQ